VIVIAESRYLAEEALDDIDVELEPLPAIVDLERASLAGSALVHDDGRFQRPRRMCARPRATMRPPRQRPHHIIKRRFLYEHGISSPIETRGVVAQWDSAPTR